MAGYVKLKSNKAAERHEGAGKNLNKDLWYIMASRIKGKPKAFYT